MLYRSTFFLLMLVLVPLQGESSPYFEKDFIIGHELVDKETSKNNQVYIYQITFQNLSGLNCKNYRYFVYNGRGRLSYTGAFTINSYGSPLLSYNGNVHPISDFYQCFSFSPGEYFDFHVKDMDGNLLAATRMLPIPLHKGFEDGAEMNLYLADIGIYRLEMTDLKPNEKIELVASFEENGSKRETVQANKRGALDHSLLFPYLFLKRGGKVSVMCQRERGEQATNAFSLPPLDGVFLKQLGPGH